MIYTITDDKRPPFRSELLEVVELTRIYLDRYFISRYESSELTNLSKVMTLFTTTSFEFGEAIPIGYESSAVFESSSILIPNTGDLDDILVSAFEGDNLDGYIGMLQALPQSNMFSSTIIVNLVETVDESSSEKSEDTSENTLAQTITLAATVIAGTAGLMLLLASTILFRRRTHHGSGGSVSGSKSIGTIAGETYATRGSRQDERMLRPICDELYNDAIADRH